MKIIGGTSKYIVILCVFLNTVTLIFWSIKLYGYDGVPKTFPQGGKMIQFS